MYLLSSSLRSQRIHFLLVLMLMAVLISFNVQANNIRITNQPVLKGQNKTEKFVYVKFDLEWQNSWRTSFAPMNYDAAWVFVKFRKAGGEWQHAYLDLDGNKHFADIYNVFPSFSVGTSFIGAEERGMGTFVYPRDDHSGPFSLRGVQLKWNYGQNGLADTDQVEIRVFAIEMAYVLEGSYHLASGGTEEGSFTSGEWVSENSLPFVISSEQSIEMGPELGKLWGVVNWDNGSSTIGPQGTLPSEFPKGFKDFYCMKYEINQSQYVTFLNTLTRQQQNARTQTELGPGVTAILERYVMSNSTTPDYKNGIRCKAEVPADVPLRFYCDLNNNDIENEAGDGHTIPCNFLSWQDGAAYCDWAGLRPMTELEFEKVCRGSQDPLANEYVYAGSTAAINTYTLENIGTPLEQVSFGYSNEGNIVCMQTSGLVGPFRSGIFAYSGSTRPSAGASYYGIMELGGNLTERVVTVGNLAGRSYTGKHGNGLLNSSGDADEDYWPGINGNSLGDTANGLYTGTGVTHAAGSGFRGGNWEYFDTYCRTSDRTDAATINDQRSRINGFRGVRTAPVLPSPLPTNY